MAERSAFDQRLLTSSPAMNRVIQIQEMTASPASGGEVRRQAGITTRRGNSGEIPLGYGPHA